MSSSLVISASVIAVVLGCAALGARIRKWLPGEHLADETKGMVLVAIGLLVTMASLALSLLLSEAKARFDDVSAEVRDAAVKIAVLDDDLRQIGAQADPIRARLRAVVESRTEAIWGVEGVSGGRVVDPGFSAPVAELRRGLRHVDVSGDEEKAAQIRALQIVDQLRQIRLLSQLNQSSEIIVPLLALIVFWFGVIGVALNVYSPQNATIRTVNVLAAMSVAGAIYLILEMNDPFAGFIRVSDTPLRSALARMQP